MKNKALNFLIFITFVLFCYPLFLQKTFGEVSLEQVLFHLMNPLKGTNPKLYVKGIGYLFLLPLLLALLYRKTHLFLPRKWKNGVLKWENSRFQAVGIGVLFLGAVGLQLHVLKIGEWLDSHRHPTTIFRDYAVTQQIENITFNQKKNAVVIYMESVESTYADGSVFKKNYIPELTELANRETSFDGFYQYPGTQWTIAGIFSGLCGLPLKIPMKGMRLDLFKTFLPNAVCVPQVLQAKGYETQMILGTNAEFSGMDNFASQHGFNKYWGIHEIEREKGGLTKEMMGHGWGLNDEAVFEFAKEKIGQAAQANKPFFFVIETMDTHFPNGFFNPKICQKSENNMTDVIRCSSKQIRDLVDWIQAQPFGPDTAIILFGDHIAMSNDVIKELRKNPHRQVVNIFINGVQPPEFKKKREFGTFDFAPTILAFLGGIVPGDAIGLGRNLFSETPTLTETMGTDTVKREIQKYSPEYQWFFGE